MTDRLKALIDKARRVRSTPRELKRHLVSFAYGNAGYEDSRVTREGVERASRATARSGE